MHIQHQFIVCPHMGIGYLKIQEWAQHLKIAWIMKVVSGVTSVLILTFSSILRTLEARTHIISWKCNNHDRDVEIDCGHEIMSFPQTFLMDNPKCITSRDVIQDRNFGLSSKLGIMVALQSQRRNKND